MTRKISVTITDHIPAASLKQGKGGYYRCYRRLTAYESGMGMYKSKVANDDDMDDADADTYHDNMSDDRKKQISVGGIKYFYLQRKT